MYTRRYSTIQTTERGGIEDVPLLGMPFRLLFAAGEATEHIVHAVGKEVVTLGTGWEEPAVQVRKDMGTRSWEPQRTRAKAPVDGKTVEKKAVEKKAVEKKAMEKKAVEKRSVDKKAVDKKAVDEKVVEKKSVEKKAVEKAPAGGPSQMSESHAIGHKRESETSRGPSKPWNRIFHRKKGSRLRMWASETRRDVEKIRDSLGSSELQVSSNKKDIVLLKESLMLKEKPELELVLEALQRAEEQLDVGISALKSADAAVGRWDSFLSQV